MSSQTKFETEEHDVSDDSTRSASSIIDSVDNGRFNLDALTEEELSHLLFEDEADEEKSGFWNLPTAAGLGLIIIGAVYLFQEMGLWSGFDVSELVAMLPFMAGILIILLGMGVLSWRPRSKKKKKAMAKAKKAAEASSAKQQILEEEEAEATKKSRCFRRSSRHKKIAGVCGGIADYFNIDPTLVRIAFVAGLFFTDGTIIIAYLLMAFILPNEDSQKEKLTAEDRIRIIRDS